MAHRNCFYKNKVLSVIENFKKCVHGIAFYKALLSNVGAEISSDHSLPCPHSDFKLLWGNAFFQGQTDSSPGGWQAD